MKTLFSLCSVLLVFKSIAMHNPKHGNSFDYIDYHYTIDSLKQPKVLVYVDSPTGQKKYVKIDSIGSTDEIVMNYTTYDNEFHQKSFEKYKISKELVTLIETSYATPYQLPTKYTIVKYIHPKRVPLDRKKTIILEAIREKSADYPYRIKISDNGQFKRSPTPMIQLYYTGNDCVKLTSDTRMKIMDTLQKVKPLNYTETHYFARGIGCIYSIERDAKNPQKKYYSLENIISLAEFEKLKNIHDASGH